MEQQRFQCVADVTIQGFTIDVHGVEGRGERGQGS